MADLEAGLATLARQQKYNIGSRQEKWHKKRADRGSVVAGAALAAVLFFFEPGNFSAAAPKVRVGR